MNEELRYNYIICFREPYCRYMFRDAEATGSAVFLKTSRAERFLRRAVDSRKLPRVLKSVLFRLQSPVLCRRLQKAAKRMADPQKPVCFILDRRYLSLVRNKGSQRIRSRFPGSKTVLFLIDLIRREPYLEEHVSGNGTERFADLIWSFDPAEAAKYGIGFHDVPISDFSGDVTPAEPEWDVVFIAKIKTRIERAMNIYRNLTARGYRCGFFLHKVPEEERGQAPEGVRFTDWMPYEEYLKTEAKGRIILEIVQDDAAGNTLRVNEAIVLQKKLLSDNPALRESPAFDPQNMFVFDDPADIPDAFLSEPPAPYPAPLKEKISPTAFLRDVEKALREGEGNHAI